MANKRQSKDETTAPEGAAETRERKPAKPKSQECGCECGGSTKGGRFLPGHDARLKSELRRTATEGKAPEKRSAIKRLEELGWSVPVTA